MARSGTDDRLGAYKTGANPEVDAAIRLAPRVEALLMQTKRDRGDIADSFAALGRILEDSEEAVLEDAA